MNILLTHQNAGRPFHHSSPCWAGLYWGGPDTAAVWFLPRHTQLPVKGKCIEMWLSPLTASMLFHVSCSLSSSTDKTHFCASSCTPSNLRWIGNQHGSSGHPARRDVWTDVWCQMDLSSYLQGSEIAGCWCSSDCVCKNTYIFIALDLLCNFIAVLQHKHWSFLYSPSKHLSGMHNGGLFPHIELW